MFCKFPDFLLKLFPSIDAMSVNYTINSRYYNNLRSVNKSNRRLVKSPNRYYKRIRKTLNAITRSQRA